MAGSEVTLTALPAMTSLSMGPGQIVILKFESHGLGAIGPGLKHHLLAWYHVHQSATGSSSFASGQTAINCPATAAQESKGRKRQGRSQISAWLPERVRESAAKPGWRSEKCLLLEGMSVA